MTGTPPYIPTTNTIATRLPVLPRYTPAHLGTVTEPLLRDQHAFVLGDALRNISGVNVQTQSGVADYFLIRGFSSLDSGLVLIDGAAEPEVPFFQMYNVDRVELLKGPGGFLYGRNPLSGAMAGVVNIVRRQPVPGIFGRARGSFGSFGTFESSVDYNRQPEGSSTGYRINGTWRQSDFYRDDKETDNFAINPAFTWRITPNASINFNLERVESSYSPDSGLPIFNNALTDVGRRTSYQSPFDASEQRINRFQADFEAKAGDHLILRNKTYHRGLDWETSGTIFNGVNTLTFSGRPELNRILTTLDDRQQITGNLFEAEVSGETGRIKHTLLAGLDTARYGDDSSLQYGLLSAIDLLDPVEPGGTPFPVGSDSFDTTSVVVAPFLIDQMEVHERLQILAGVRMDWLDYKDDTSSVSLHEREVSPTAGIVFLPTKALTLYANYGRSFGPPAARIAQPGPKPRESVQFEAGMKLHPAGGKTQTTMAIYHLDLSNIPIPDATGVSQAAGDQDAMGLEIEFAAEPMPGLHGFLSYGYNDAELTRFTESVIVGYDPMFFFPIYATVDRSGNRPEFAPEHILNLWVSKRFANGFGVGGGGRYVSDQYIWVDNAYRSGAYTTLDAALYWTVRDFDFQLNVKNLTGSEYETRSIGSGAVIPADGLALYGSLQYRF